ncbi:WD repeat-containing protein on Y chromosome-like, partial [Asbolus verrucosus]
VFGKLIEWGIQCIYPGPKRNSLNDFNLEIWDRSPIVVTCCNHIALIKIVYQDEQIEKGLEMQVLPPPPLQNSVLVPNIEDVSRQEMDPEILGKRLEELKFILDKDLFADNGSNNSDINFKIATLERKKLHMQQHVERGAPYLALELHEIEDLYLTPDLPVPNKRKIKNFVGKVEKVLQDANFRDFVFSEASSSRSPRSSRSSIVEFEY